MTLTVSVEDIVANSENPILGIHPSWKRVQLGKIATVLNGYAFDSARFSKTEGMPLLRIRDIKGESTEIYYTGSYDHRYLVEPGDLVIGMDGDFNCSRWRGPTALLNQRVCKIILQTDSYDPRLLDIALPSYLKAINEVTSSLTVKHLSSKTVAEIPLPLPPLQEQHRIVAKLDELLTKRDVGVAALQRVQALLKRYRASVLKAACEGRLVPQDPNDEPAETLLERILTERRAKWEDELRAKGKDPAKTKYEEPEPPDIGGLPELPTGWCWATSMQICSAVASGSTPKADKMYSGSGDVPFVKVYNLTFGDSIDFRIKPTYIDTSTHLGLLARSRTYPGDVLMNIVGPPLGKVSLVPNTYAEWNINQAIVVFRAMEGVLPNYLRAALFCAPTQARLQRTAKATAGQSNLAVTTCRKLPLPLPPLAEQQRIMADIEWRLSVVDVLDEVVTANAVRTDRLRQTILARAFEGKLVPQDSDDEPASALLERILGQTPPQPDRKHLGARIELAEGNMPQSIDRQPITEVLPKYPNGLKPEQLLQAAGFNVDSIEEFYDELRREVNARRVVWDSVAGVVRRMHK